ncbi:MAG: bifunctional tetrahydrofolate synthase/dihydrofolate synthase [Pseudomonadota bacterium]
MSTPNAETDLMDWLAWQEGLHHQEIDLGLERVGQVARELNLPNEHSTITVAGTNGKGSCIHYLQSIFLARGLSVGTFTSPHLTRYNERVRVNGTPVADDALVDAFHRINTARQQIPLTYFEFSTLAALDIFAKRDLDVQLLEVGLGGRLDATNIVDANIAIITSIDLDHQAWLGNTREAIGFEKAGILKPDSRGICGDPNPPDSIAQAAAGCGCEMDFLTRDFGFEDGVHDWCYWDSDGDVGHLPKLKNHSDVQMANAACAIRATRVSGLPIRDNHYLALSETVVPGRAEIVSGDVNTLLDVAHNPASVRVLRERLDQMDSQRVLGVVGMLADKDVEDTLAPMVGAVDYWYVGQIHHHRAMDAFVLARLLKRIGAKEVRDFDSVEQAVSVAKTDSVKGDTLLIFGSFHTVGAALSVGI